MVITSLDNKKIKKYANLNNSKNRYEEGLFIVEGMHLCQEANNEGILIDILTLEDNQLNFDYSGEITYVTSKILNRISSLKSDCKIIGICQIKMNKKIVGDHLLLLDGIQDPGNLGTIIRSACAFNVDTIILSSDCVDIYNEKVLRSTQGMLFHMNIVYMPLKDVILKLKEQGYKILGTNVRNGVNIKTINVSKYCLIMGNEGRGVSEEIQEMCDTNIYIKMNQKCESLNVAVATSILLYELGEK